MTTTIPAPNPAAGPVTETKRISALDATRGLALLGIFLVNIQSFGEPFGRFIDPVVKDETGLNGLAHFFVRAFCEGKFYTLFSMLFGMGLVLQMGRVRAAGRRFGPLYIRRLLVLGLMGLAHGLLLWYGDILFLYSIAGAILLLFSQARAKTLIIAGIVILSIATLISTGMGALMFVAPPTTALQAQPAPAGSLSADESQFFEEVPAPETPAPAETAADPTTPTTPPPAVQPAPVAEKKWPPGPFFRLIRGFEEGTIGRGGNPTVDPLWVDAEIEAYRDGPYLQAFLFRAMTFGMMLVFCLLGFGWTIIAMFFIGAGLMKLGVFEPHRRHWHRRFLAVGVLVGAPASIIAALAPSYLGVTPWVMMASTFLHMAFGPLLSLGYLGGITLLVTSGGLRPITASLANIGRMALSNYLLQTVIATFIFYHWGLGMFAQTERAERVAMVLGIYLAQHVLSAAWLKAFTMGPVEWLWRTLTYLRVQPFRRRYIPDA